MQHYIIKRKESLRTVSGQGDREYEDFVCRVNGVQFYGKDQKFALRFENYYDACQVAEALETQHMPLHPRCKRIFEVVSIAPKGDFQKSKDFDTAVAAEAGK